MIASCRSEMGRVGLRCLTLLAAVLMLGVAVGSLSAADIVVKEVGGTPVMRCKIRYGRQYIDTHVIFNINLQSPLVIHSRTIRGLGLHPMMVKGKTVDLEFAANTRLKGVPIQITEDKLLETMTRLYAGTLNQVPVTAMIGLGAFKENVIELDMQRRLLRSLKLASDEARAREMDCKIMPSGVLVKGIGPEKSPVTVMLSTKQLDSYMAISLLEAARKSGKRPIPLQIGDIDCGRQTAFRFSRAGLPGAPVDAQVVLGLGALRNHAVTIWPKRNKIAFIQKKQGHHPRAEQAYFYALVDRDPKGIREFVKAHNSHRLLDGALMNLWKMRSADNSCTTQELKTILDMVGAKYDKIRRAMALSQVSDSIEAGERADRDELSSYALKLAMAQSGKALNHSTVHGVHLRLGKKAFAKGDLKMARRHLLSAAFGLPKNAECNFWLAEVYRKMGKPRRAWSRYYQAIVDVGVEDQLKAEALHRIELLNRDPEFRKTFTMLMAEEYTSGRSAAGEFHAPYRYKLEKRQFPGHVRLVESFVNSDKPDTSSQQLALRGLDEYFEGRVALVEYHLVDRMHSDVAVNRLNYYRTDSQPSMVFDGQPAKVQYTPPRSDDRVKKAKAYYDALKAQCLLKTPVSDSLWTLKANMTRKGQTMSGTVSVTGKGETDTVRLHAIVCERSVMTVQKNGVLFHRFVARTALTPPKGTAVSDLIGKPLKFSLDAGALAKKIGSGTYVDARLLTVVAFLQRQNDQRILAAESFSLPEEEEAF